MLELAQVRVLVLVCTRLCLAVCPVLGPAERCRPSQALASSAALVQGLALQLALELALGLALELALELALAAVAEQARSLVATRPHKAPAAAMVGSYCSAGLMQLYMTPYSRTAPR